MADPSTGSDSRAAAQFTAVLGAVASGTMPMNEFYGYFMSRVPAWDQQDDLQRRLVLLLDHWDGETTPAGQSMAAGAVREAARAAMDEGITSGNWSSR
jgi:hypothetical protein